MITFFQEVKHFPFTPPCTFNTHRYLLLLESAFFLPSDDTQRIFSVSISVWMLFCQFREYLLLLLLEKGGVL